MQPNEKKSFPPISIMVLTIILGAMNVGALASRLVQKNIGIDNLITVVLLIACVGVWQLRKWAVWLLLVSLLSFAVYHTHLTDTPVRNFLYNGLPFVLIAVTCTVPHYKRMQ